MLALNFWDWFYFLTSPQLFNPFSVGIGVILAVIGVWIALKATRVIDVSTVSDMRTDRKPELITTGIYSKIRHPLYLALVLLFIGLTLIYPFPEIIIFSVSFTVYLLIGTYLEEKKLILQYGKEYLEYKKQAGFMTPKF
jgi:protein-S-isoprenylcysteine O-methyltransferase Ste14